MVMDPLCIICLTLIPSADVSHVTGTSLDQATDNLPGENSDTTPPLKGDVAHLQNCRHTFHDHCLAEWTEVFAPFLNFFNFKVANTCPACRANFNQVDISDTLEGG